MGFMHATPGDMKSFKSSAESMALMIAEVKEKDETRKREQELRVSSVDTKISLSGSDSGERQSKWMLLPGGNE